MNKPVLIAGMVAVVVIIIAVIVLLFKDNSKEAETSDKPQRLPDTNSSGSKMAALFNYSAGTGFIDYDTYEMSKKEFIFWVVAAGTLLFGIGYVFYRHIIWALVLSLFGLLYPRIKKKDIIIKRKNELIKQFKEALYLIVSSLSVGKSVEMSFVEALSELKNFYENPNTFIIKEFEIIVRRINMNETVEDALQDFARRAHQEDIQSFADIFNICKRTGGNLNTIMRTSSSVIGDKIEIKQDISAQISGQKYEAKVLTFIPVFIIVFLQYTAGDFMAPVYVGVAGRLLMTVALIMIGIGSLWAQKIVNIEV